MMFKVLSSSNHFGILVLQLDKYQEVKANYPNALSGDQCNTTKQPPSSPLKHLCKQTSVAPFLPSKLLFPNGIKHYKKLAKANASQGDMAAASQTSQTTYSRSGCHISGNAFWRYKFSSKSNLSYYQDQGQMLSGSQGDVERSVRT